MDNIVERESQPYDPSDTGIAVSYGVLPAGRYCAKYIAGAFKRSSSFDWSVAGMQFVDSTLTPVTYLTIHGDDGGYYPTQIDAEVAVAGYFVTFDWPGGELFIRLDDYPYSDNVEGSPNPIFQVCRIATV